MAWRTVDIHEQRHRLVVAATQKARPFRALCAEFEISDLQDICGCGAVK